MTLTLRAHRYLAQPWPWALLACVTGLFRITTQSPWFDELLTLDRAQSGLVAGVAASFREFHLPLYPALAWLFSAGGSSLLGARLASTLAFVAGAPAMFCIARKWSGERAAIFAALLYCGSPILVWHSQDARHYAQLVLVSVCALAALLAALEGSKPALFALAASVALGLMTHVYFAAFCVALFVHAMSEWRGTPAAKRTVATLCAAGAAMLPLLVSLYLSSRGTQTGSPKPLSLATLGYPALTFGVGYSFGPTVYEMHFGAMEAMRPYLPQVVLAILAFWAPVAAGFVYVARESKRDAWVRLVYLVVPLALPFGAALAQPSGTFNVRYALPSLVVALALGAHAVTRGPRWAQIACAVSLVAVELVGLGAYYFDERHFKEDYAGAAAYLEAHAGPGDTIAAGPAPKLFNYLLPDRQVQLLDAHAVSAPAGRPAFFVVSRPWEADPDGSLQRALRADPQVRCRHFHEVDVCERDD